MPSCCKEIDIEKSLWSALHGTFSFCSAPTLVMPWMVPRTPPVSLEELPYSLEEPPAPGIGNRAEDSYITQSLLQVALFLIKGVFRLTEDQIGPFPGLTAAGFWGSCRLRADVHEASAWGSKSQPGDPVGAVILRFSLHQPVSPSRPQPPALPPRGEPEPSLHQPASSRLALQSRPSCAVNRPLPRKNTFHTEILLSAPSRIPRPRPHTPQARADRWAHSHCPGEMPF